MMKRPVKPPKMPAMPAMTTAKKKPVVKVKKAVKKK